MGMIVHYRQSRTSFTTKRGTISGPCSKAWLPPNAQDCRHLTAFCTPAGTFEWKILPMGVKDRPHAFHRLVGCCVGQLKPHIRVSINDILVGMRPTGTGKGKLLDLHAIIEH